MKKLVLGAAFALTLVSSASYAAKPKTYQATGEVLEVSDDSVTIQKGKEKWQLARDKDTQVEGDLKKGAKATVIYTMNATKITVKGAAAKTGKSTGKAETPPASTGTGK